MTPLEEALEVARFGGKAAQLARARAAGLPVPEGWALTWDLAHAIAEGAPPPPLPTEGLWAVRSSAVDEDGATASFAGQHLTRLNVPTSGLHAAIVAVVASGADAGARAYRARVGADETARVGVVIQRLVPARVSGVLFTRDPISGADTLRIEASWGLGEVVVQGLVTPDGWRLSRAGEVLETFPGEKDVELVREPGGGTTERPVTGARVHAPCLDAAGLARLTTLAHALDRVFDGPHDVEWAFDEQDRLFLLQRRSITGWTL